MLIVVVPVILLTLAFAWRYGAGNARAKYLPNWSHSVAVEVVVWTIPSLIILFLGVLTWRSTHELDPYRPIASASKPVDVDVVALDWKWLFIYPAQGIATVNQLAMPVGRPVNFHLTSDTVMNSFFIPRLGSQIYAMAGMETQLHLIADAPGTYEGISANFSGPGFSDMKFRVLALPDSGFPDWVRTVRRAPAALTEAEYKRLAAPSEADPVAYFARVEPGLFRSVVMKYAVPAGHEHKPMRMSSAASVMEH